LLSTLPILMVEVELSLNFVTVSFTKIVTVCAEVRRGLTFQTSSVRECVTVLSVILLSSSLSDILREEVAESADTLLQLFVISEL